MRVGFYIEGGEQLARNLGTLGSRVEKNVVRTAVRRGQEAMLRQAIANARALPRSEKRLIAVDTEDIRMSELIARNIVIAPPRKQIAGSYSLHVQMRRNVPEFVHTAQGAHTLVDFRWTDRHGVTRRRIGRTVGVTYIPAAIEYGHGADPASAARPFMRPAADSTRVETMRILVQELHQGILREAIKARYEAAPAIGLVTVSTSTGSSAA